MKPALHLRLSFTSSFKELFILLSYNKYLLNQKIPGFKHFQSYNAKREKFLIASLLQNFAKILSYLN